MPHVVMEMQHLGILLHYIAYLYATMHKSVHVYKGINAGMMLHCYDSNALLRFIILHNTDYHKEQCTYVS